jgi:hypothetical protein
VLSDLEALEAELIQTKSESGQDPINYPPMLDDQIAYLYSIVNGQDDRPTEGAYQRYEDVKKAYEVHHQAFQQLCAEQLPKLNSQLNNAGFKVIGAEDR